ncbi:hypothetical protein ACH4LN_10580 [Streptomyces albus]|uniref:hypothetical protein n=1 Tax=Streptomyces TaxID=1883 RepID=UPI00034ECBA2|nr:MULTISPECIES: hypothetical protein [Streptomyces]EPD96036.1 hypothetical protein HMPREF1486_01066 [Streptomyces sp. HPH0547]MDI6411543.1 hypothetical protein [Streptomyces albus]UVN57717.1 hypothetical protein NR995_26705 [Streptomyces albus]GHJ20219.1 hypothetical protein TPA0909_18330 [Streptomyces albus]
MALFLFLVLVAIVLGIFGAVLKGLFYLLIIGIVVALIAFLWAGYRITSRANNRRVR